MYIQKHQRWWKQRSFAPGQVGHGHQEIVETIERARISALTLRKDNMELATLPSQLTSVFATSLNLVNLSINSLVGTVCILHKIRVS